MEFKRNKKGQSMGMVVGLVTGVAALVIAVIIALVITSTLSDSDILIESRPAFAISNESGFLNQTGYTLVEYDSTFFSFTISGAANYSGATLNGSSIDSSFYTLTSGVVRNATNTVWGNFDTVVFNYTFATKSDEEDVVSNMTANFTDGIDNVSEKIPTVLLIAAILLILGILVLLVGMWQKMNLGQGGL